MHCGAEGRGFRQSRSTRWRRLGTPALASHPSRRWARRAFRSGSTAQGLGMPAPASSRGFSCIMRIATPPRAGARRGEPGATRP